MDFSRKFFPKGEAVTSFSFLNIVCFRFIARKRASSWVGVFPRAEKGESQAACPIIITFKLQYTFTVVQDQHINFAAGNSDWY